MRRQQGGFALKAERILRKDRNGACLAPTPEDGPADLLRLADEPWVHIGEGQVHAILMDHLVDFMKLLSAFYDTWPSGDAIQLPTKQVFNRPGLHGDFRVMPCVIHPLKISCVKIIGTNEEQRAIADKICVGKAMLIDYDDNHVYALFDVCALSSFRTAAIACLALHRSGRNPAAVGIVGAGRIGFYTAAILHRWCGVDSLGVCDPDPVNRGRFSALCRAALPELIVKERPLKDLCEESEALFLATTSKTPLCGGDNSAHIPFIASVGADADNLSEVDPSLLQTHRLVTDSLQSLCLGDMKRWSDGGVIHEGMVTELKALGNQGTAECGRILFISTGVALQDALACHFVYERLHGKMRPFGSGETGDSGEPSCP